MLYRLYQLFVCLPILGIVTILTAFATILGCTLGKASFWAYWPPCIWSRFMCRIPLLPVEIVGGEKLHKDISYVFVSNHQGPYDIFLIYGYLGHSFRWLMKKELRSIPLIGRACEKAGHIMVDKSGPKAIARTQAQARETLCGGTSIVVFPELVTEAITLSAAFSLLTKIIKSSAYLTNLSPLFSNSLSSLFK